jgi:3',5'-cyclic-AMP phosphodiesterase
MRIKSIVNHIVAKLDYYSAAIGHEGGIIENSLPVYIGEIEGLTANVDALIVCSDLQGFVVENHKEMLLGEYVPEFISSLIASILPIVNQDKVGVLLPGDYFADLQYRGGLGDVRKVWFRFKHF